MANMSQCVIKCVNGQLYVFSWTTGFKKTHLPKLKSEDEILRECLRLERLGQADEADRLLQQYCG